MSQLPPLPVVIPLLAAAVIAGLGKEAPRRLVNALALATASATLALAVVLLAESRAQTLVYWFGNWRPHGGIALGICFAIDPIGAGLAVLAALLTLVALLFSLRYFESAQNLYPVLMLVFLAGMEGFGLSGDLFNIFVFFELMGAAAFALCGYRAEEPGPALGALNFAVLNTLAAFLVLIGIGLLYARTGALNLAQIGQTLGAAPPDGLVIVAFALIFSGFLTKGAIVPFHFWLADAHAVAPTPVCVLLSGVMVELGLYAVARIYWTVFAAAFAPHAAGLRAILTGAGAVTALLGGVLCFAQGHLKRLLAFSTISHMGMMMIGFGMLTAPALAGAALYLLGHGLAKAALFVAVGILLHRRNSVEESRLHGRGKGLWGTAALFLFGGLALAGFPPFGLAAGAREMGAAAKNLGQSWFAAVDLIAGILTGGAVLRVAGGVFLGWGPKPAQEPGPPDETRETEAAHRRTPPEMALPAAILLALALAAGLSPRLTAGALRSAQRLVNQRAYAARVLANRAPAAPVTPSAPAAPVAPFDEHAWWAGVGAAALALFSLFRARLRRTGPRLQKAWMTAVGPLRSAHSGLVGDYVAWLTAGVAIFGLLFAGVLR